MTKKGLLGTAILFASWALSPPTSAEELWVSIGTTEDLSARRPNDPYHFVVPAGKSADKIVDIAIDGRNNTSFAWFRGKPRQVSGGSTRNLGEYRAPYTSYFPEGYNSGDVAGIAINESAGGVHSYEKETTFVFFRDGKYTAGTTDNPRGHGKLYRYVPAGGKRYRDIVAIAMDGIFSSRDKRGVRTPQLVVYAWYKDGTVSAGFMPTTVDRLSGDVADLDSYRTSYGYELPDNWQPGMKILGIGIDGENNHVYTWYRKQS